MLLLQESCVSVDWRRKQCGAKRILSYIFKDNDFLWIQTNIFVQNVLEINNQPNQKRCIISQRCLNSIIKKIIFNLATIVLGNTSVGLSGPTPRLGPERPSLVLRKIKLVLLKVYNQFLFPKIFFARFSSKMRKSQRVSRSQPRCTYELNLF